MRTVTVDKPRTERDSTSINWPSCCTASSILSLTSVSTSVADAPG